MPSSAKKILLGLTNITASALLIQVPKAQADESVCLNSPNATNHNGGIVMCENPILFNNVTKLIKASCNVTDRPESDCKGFHRNEGFGAGKFGGFKCSYTYSIFEGPNHCITDTLKTHVPDGYGTHIDKGSLLLIIIFGAVGLGIIAGTLVINAAMNAYQRANLIREEEEEEKALRSNDHAQTDRTDHDIDGDELETGSRTPNTQSQYGSLGSQQHSESTEQQKEPLITGGGGLRNSR